MYSTPTPAEFREFLKAHGLTGSEAARLLGKDSRAIRRYAAPADQPGSRSIQWDSWALLRILTGAATINEIKEEIANQKPSSGAGE